MNSRGGSDEMLKSKKIDILFIQESGKSVRSVTLPRAVLSCFGLFFVLSALALGWIISDYRTSKPRIAELARAEQICFDQKKHIAYLGQRIQDIHEKLKELDDYDFRLRTVAHIATGDEGGSLVGVGGSNPGGISEGVTEPALVTRTLQGGHAARPAGGDPEEGLPANHEFPQTAGLLALSQTSRWPVKGWVSSRFGLHPGAVNGDPEFHSGVDIATRENGPVSAPADGVITEVAWREGYGRRVVLSHGLGVVSVFSHLDKVFVSKGERLRQGDVIATAAGSGRSIGPYVHYEVHFYGVPVNPQKPFSSFIQ